ncbi:MAG: DUF2283 domain-containing protein [Candidatus Gracilibacteria bacterium]
MTNITFDKEANAGYLSFSDNNVSKTIALNNKIICDLDETGMIVGIEFIGIKKDDFSKNISNLTFK